ncbi:cytoplasmic protein [Paenibacillus stellifer]|uniref:Cytoplasmic protein n=1 Tax=Paenibacillus stellifer TaxID=169760 RepID=A0A089LZ94_9BACL|nr:DUF4180 domain-containing protein [Paenibacillus stellifer]AIQ65420.1 cytoplasmic protein [Paenibacillus stellifer]
MNITTINRNGIDIAAVSSDDLLITDVQSALDLMATVRYEAGTSRIVVKKSAISEDFFDLKTRLAGEILQKFINYETKLAIYGDFSGYSSKSLKDFIYESNNGKDIFFVNDEEQAVEKLSKV